MNVLVSFKRAKGLSKKVDQKVREKCEHLEVKIGEHKKAAAEQGEEQAGAAVQPGALSEQNARSRATWSFDYHNGVYSCDTKLLAMNQEFRAFSENRNLFKLIESNIEKLEKQLLKSRKKIREKIHREKKHPRYSATQLAENEKSAVISNLILLGPKKEIQTEKQQQTARKKTKTARKKTALTRTRVAQKKGTRVKTEREQISKQKKAS